MEKTLPPLAQTKQMQEYNKKGKTLAKANMKHISLKQPPKRYFSYYSHSL
jgi:hypothetical protein